jgi:ribosomal protein L7Ae-like RNA K-turn-binding protein
MRNERLLSALGFARKAGKVRSGEYAAEKAIKGGKALLAVLDESASENSKKHWADICKNAGVPLVMTEGAGRAIGREAHTIACITDNGFAQMILRCKQEYES